GRACYGGGALSQRQFRPMPSETTAPFWEATRECRLLLQWCLDCQRHVHHPREVCPRCLGQNLTWRESAGNGTVHALSVHYRPFETMSKKDCPYVVAFVDLDEGVRFLANLVEIDPEKAAVGDRVELSWIP